MEKNNRRDALRASLVQQTASITGLSTRQVRRVINSTSENEKVLGVYMELLEGNNTLVKHLRELVPLN